MEKFLLKQPAVTRRDFMKIAGASLALLGLSQTLSPKVVKALEANAGKVPVIWLEGQSCTGCSLSFTNNLDPSAATLLLDTISLRYHETLMAASGYQSEQALHDTIEEGGYILVIEGSIPMAEDGKFCTVGGKTFKEIVRDAAKNAAVIVPVGSCATFGGIPGAGPTDAVGYLYRGTKLHHEYDDVTGNKPVINLPTCPMHNERLVAVIVYYLTFGEAPPLDKWNRPVAFYGELMHDNCERRGNFEAGRFLTDWGDPKQKDWCLYLKGCRGPQASHDCWKRKWNGSTQYCISANAPCVGCSEPEFYKKISPLYQRALEPSLPIIGRVNIDKVMATVAGVAAVGIGADMLISRMKKGEEES